jgi:hypothetical protein
VAWWSVWPHERASPSGGAEALKPSGGPSVERASSEKRSPAAVAPGRASEAAGRRQYLLGRKALQRGEDSLAIQALRKATSTSESAYFIDDALYLLMLAEERVGDRSSARGTAGLILERHPASIYANSRTRRLASAATPMAGP